MLRKLTYLLFLCGMVSGCADKKLDVRYGRSHGDASASVNGTSVLARMFSDAGFRVRSTRWLSPRTATSDTIIWFPDSFDTPDSATREFFINQWFFEGSEKTLVYVGRDYDASIAYWQRMAKTAPPDQVVATDRALARCQIQFDQMRGRSDESHEGWFRFDYDQPRRQIETLSGSWGDGIDPERTEMEIGARIVIAGDLKSDNEADEESEVPTYGDPLLMSGDDVLVTRITSGFGRGNQIIVVANGSFLLNLGLVNHEHRKLAERLIDECGMPCRLTFLESGPGSPHISNDDKFIHPFVKAFTVWPLNCIFLQLTVLGIVLCLSLFPIFGRPRSLNEGPGSDFGKHIDALGQLLSATGDTAYAKARLNEYQQLSHHDKEAPKERPVARRVAPPHEPVSSSPFAPNRPSSEDTS